jgi:hypothetical protein
MRLTLLTLSVMIALTLAVLGDARRPHKQETPYAAALFGWSVGRQYVYLTREDVPHDRINTIPRDLRTEEAVRGYFDASRKSVAWADLNTNVIVLDTEDLRSYSRVLLIEGSNAGKIGWVARRFVHRSARTLTGQPNTEKVNAAQRKVAYDAKDRRIYSVTYAQAHNMHDAGGDLLVVVPMSLLPAEARLSRAMNGKLD